MTTNTTTTTETRKPTEEEIAAVVAEVRRVARAWVAEHPEATLVGPGDLPDELQSAICSVPAYAAWRGVVERDGHDEIEESLGWAVEPVWREVTAQLLVRGFTVALDAEAVERSVERHGTHLEDYLEGGVLRLDRNETLFLCAMLDTWHPTELDQVRRGPIEKASAAGLAVWRAWRDEHPDVDVEGREAEEALWDAEEAGRATLSSADLCALVALPGILDRQLDGYFGTLRGTLLDQAGLKVREHILSLEAASATAE